MTRAPVCTLLLCLLLLVCACDQQTEPLARVVESGPLSVELALDDAPITTAERLPLTVTWTICGMEYATPRVNGESIDDTEWRIVEATPLEERFLDARTRTGGVELVLEPFLAGDYTLPPLTVSTSSDAGPIELRTEPIAISVRSLLDEAGTGAPLGEFREPPDMSWSGAVAPVLAMSVFGLGLITISAGLVIASLQKPAPFDAHAVAQCVARALASDDYHAASKSLQALALRADRREDIEPMLERLDLARFGGRPIGSFGDEIRFAAADLAASLTPTRGAGA